MSKVLYSAIVLAAFHGLQVMGRGRPTYNQDAYDDAFKKMKVIENLRKFEKIGKIKETVDLTITDMHAYGGLLAALMCAEYPEKVVYRFGPPPAPQSESSFTWRLNAFEEFVLENFGDNLDRLIERLVAFQVSQARIRAREKA